MCPYYRIPIRIKKWWFPIYTWSLSVCTVNAWRLRMRHTGTREPYLNFLREHGGMLRYWGGMVRNIYKESLLCITYLALPHKMKNCYCKLPG